MPSIYRRFKIISSSGHGVIIRFDIYNFKEEHDVILTNCFIFDHCIKIDHISHLHIRIKFKYEEEMNRFLLENS